MAYIYRRGKYFWVGYYEGARSIQKSLKVTSKKAAEILLAEYQLREAKSRNKSKALIIRKPIVEVFDEYIENRASRERTKEWYRWCRDLFLSYCTGNGLRFITDIQADTIEAFYNERKKEAPGGARSNLRALKAVLNYAVKKEYLHENLAKVVKGDKPTRKMFRDLTSAEIEKLLDTTRIHSPSFYPLFATAYYAGLREGEVIYLEPGDINYNQGYIHIRTKPENLIKDHQERKVPLNSKLREALKEVKPNGRWLFETKGGKPRKNNLNRELKRIGKITGIDVNGLCMQVLRETFGSHLRRKGVDIALISQYMGHSSIDVTLRHYAHIAIEQTHKEIDLL